MSRAFLVRSGHLVASIDMGYGEDRAAISIATREGDAMRILAADTFERPALDEQDIEALCEAILNRAIADQGLHGVRALVAGASA